MTNRKLGEFSLELFLFPGLEDRLHRFQKSDFLNLPERVRVEKVHQLLLDLISEVPPPCFLLAAVNEFISLVNKLKWLEAYSLSKFELWLNVFSGLDAKENYLVRGKIMGKYIPREAYQSLFPIGMGKVYSGSHYVTAHSSPDLDTTVASFWGWVDSFAARVGTGLHIWNIPGGPPASQVEIQFLFEGLLGRGCFDHFAKTRTSLALSAADLMTREGMVTKKVEDSLQSLSYDKKQKAIVLVDTEENYLGDWRSLDMEAVKRVTSLLNSSMRWFVACFQRDLTVFLSKEIVSSEGFSLWLQSMFSIRLEESEVLKESAEEQKKNFDECLIKVFNISGGWTSSFKQFWTAMENLSLKEFKEFRLLLESLPSSSLFNGKGLLEESRPEIFHYLEKIVISLEKAIQSLRHYIDTFEVAFTIKREVFKTSSQAISSRTEVEEMRSKMGSLAYLTVTSSDSEGRLFPLGIVSSTNLFHSVLGTVSLRDFCNREETKIPSYFEVISVVDHHKSVLNTSSATTIRIADAQSANALVAELAFEVNDSYSLSGMSAQGIDQQLKECKGSLLTSFECRILQRLLQKRLIAEKIEGYFIHPHREYLEYLQFLYAILDDTDLLSKVSFRDVACVASLLNRMKSIVLGRESEVISFHDLPQDEKFVLKAAERVLQNEEMYSLYKKIYESKEIAIEESLRFCIKGESSSVFADTKVQNGCCRVGQTKLFAKNFPFYAVHAHEIRALWYVDAKAFYEERKECDLHMHMISTVPGAEDVYTGSQGNYEHKDELWIWIPMEEQAIEHLKTFLSAFRFSSQIVTSSIEVEFLGENEKAFEQIFTESFSSANIKKTEKEKKISIPVAVLRYKAGLLNSRKAMISPYLPKLIS